MKKIARARGKGRNGGRENTGNGTMYPPTTRFIDATTMIVTGLGHYHSTRAAAFNYCQLIHYTVLRHYIRATSY